jgi:hypothetical protein
MKPIACLLPLLFVLLFSNGLAARCAGSGIQFFPAAGAAIPASPVFVIELFAGRRELADSIGSAYAVTLRGQGMSIPCRVEEILRGTCNGTQVIVRPSKSLAPGASYTLHVALPAAQAHLESSAVYTVAAKDAGEAKLAGFTGEPEWKSSHYTMLGCGPAISVNYFAAKSGRPVWMYTTLTAPDGTAGTYLIPVEEDGNFTIGHGMCSGSFALQPGAAYTAVIYLMDAAGRKSAASKTFSFHAPATKHADNLPRPAADRAAPVRR